MSAEAPAEVPQTVQKDDETEKEYKNESPALVLFDDTASQVEVVLFKRDEGAALLVAEDVKSEEYVQLDLPAWDSIVAVCKEVQPNAQFTV